MNLELRWQESAWTSCLHAAQILAGKPPENVSTDLLTALAPPVQQLVKTVEQTGIPPKLFWRHALPLSSEIHGKAELASLVLRKTRGIDFSQSPHVKLLGGALADLANAYEKAVPKAAEELPLRRRPLQEAWEARGPGMLYFLSRVLPEDFVPELATVILVLPISAGRGTAHLKYNSLRMEAVLYDPHPQLPEVVRLAWLISQLNIDLPKYSELIPPERVPLVARLATIPAVLYAAEEVELVKPGTIRLADALQIWQVSHAGHETLADIVAKWWHTQETRQASWHVALAGLDRMLG